MPSITAAPASSTPILDRLAPLPEPAAPASGSRILLGVGAALFVTLGILVVWNPSFHEPLSQWILTQFQQQLPGSWTLRRAVFVVVALAVIGFSITAIHELGHLIVGLCVGFRSRSMLVGPLQLNGRPFRITLNPDPRSWFHGGVTLFPIKTDRLCERGIAMVLAGPGANLLTGCAVLLLPFPLGVYSGFFVVTSIAAGVIELLLPIRGPTFVFDGRRIHMLLLHRELGERWLALMRLSAETSAGVLPESLTADFLAKAIAVRDDSADTVVAHAFAYSAEFHRHHDAEAGQMLEVCLTYAGYAPPALRAALMSDAAVFQARRRKRADLAEQWLAAMPSTTAWAWLRPRVEAAILEGRGDVDGALRKLDEWETAILSLPNPAQREILLRLLRRWQAELNGCGEAAL